MSRARSAMQEKKNSGWVRSTSWVAVLSGFLSPFLILDGAHFVWDLKSSRLVGLPAVPITLGLIALLLNLVQVCIFYEKFGGVHVFFCISLHVLFYTRESKTDKLLLRDWRVRLRPTWHTSSAQQKLKLQDWIDWESLLLGTSWRDFEVSWEQIRLDEWQRILKVDIPGGRPMSLICKSRHKDQTAKKTPNCLRSCKAGAESCDQIRDQKLHAAVAKSAYGPDHFNIPCSFLFEIEGSKFWSSNVEKLHAAVGRSAF